MLFGNRGLAAPIFLNPIFEDRNVRARFDQRQCPENVSATGNEQCQEDETAAQTQQESVNNSLRSDGQFDNNDDFPVPDISQYVSVFRRSLLSETFSINHRNRR
jgi:hypothetical protein